MMQLTLRDARKIVLEELGRDPAKSTVEELVNEAGERWVSAVNWRYLRERTTEIQLESGVESYRLGAGIQSLGRILHRPDTIWEALELMEFSSFVSYKERFLAGIERPFNPVATTTWDVREGDERRHLYLHIFPGGISERLVVEYRAGWLPMDGLDDAADIPPFLVVHFRDWLRMYAMHREFPELYPVGAMDAFRGTGSFIDAKRQDAESVGRIQPAPGRAGRNYYDLKTPRYGTEYEALRHYYERGFGRGART